MQDYQHDYQQRTADDMETLQPAKPAFTPDSPSSETDAGLDDANLEQTGAQPVTQANVIEIPEEIQEISMTDLADATTGSLEAGELSDLNAPGEVDIEDLDESALSDTDIPPDALLDPLEE